MNYFPPAEVEKTGANFVDVDPHSYGCLNAFRHRLGVPVHLIFNGVTTGTHRAKEHAQGKAFDCHVNGRATPSAVVYAAVAEGFRGVGVYWNGTAHSYHLDTRPVPALWTAERIAGQWVHRPVYPDKGLPK